jgi:nicotinamide riboside transporter PnuC
MAEVIDIAGWMATVIAVAGVWMNNKRLRACFILWMFSNALSLGVHAAAGMWSMAVRDGAFFVLAIHGWRLWSNPFSPEAIHENDQSIGD